MLARVAERIYWMARYLERAENSARLVSVNSHLLLDLPSGVELGWSPLVEITGSRQEFDAFFEDPSEKSVTRFLLADTRNPSSMLNSINFARENARTIRDIIPGDAWEQINELTLFVKNALPSGLARKNRFEFLQNTIQLIQQITGMLAGTMLHDVGYDFLKMGRNLERADMTSRIVDVRSEKLLISDTEDLIPFEQIQWVSVLHSLSAYQAYRQEVPGIIKSENVLRFLLCNLRFPRSFAHCMEEVRRCLKHLPNEGKKLAQTADDMIKSLEDLKFEQLHDKKLYRVIDKLQIDIGKLNNKINESYFALDKARKLPRKKRSPAKQKTAKARQLVGS